MTFHYKPSTFEYPHLWKPPYGQPPSHRLRPRPPGQAWRSCMASLSCFGRVPSGSTLSKTTKSTFYCRRHNLYYIYVIYIYICNIYIYIYVIYIYIYIICITYTLTYHFKWLVELRRVPGVWPCGLGLGGATNTAVNRILRALQQHKGPARRIPDLACHMSSEGFQSIVSVK